MTEKEVREPDQGKPAGELASEARIEDLIVRWHEAANAGDYDTMWSLLSARKRSQILRNQHGARTDEGTRKAEYPAGRESWETAQSDFIGALDTSDVEVSLTESGYPDEEAVTIKVTGMVYAGECPWEGITWVRSEQGKWRYEPGYLVSPDRAKDWRGSDDLLRNRCS